MRVIHAQEYMELVNEYQKLIFHLCYSFTKNYFDAEDLAQETFLTAYRKREQFDGRNFKAWITTIAANKCKDYLKSPARKVTGITDEMADLLEDPAGGTERQVLKKMEEQNVYDLCRRLKEPYQSVAVAYFCKDQKLSDLSKETGEKLKTLETRLYRAKKTLAVLWKEEMHEHSV